MVAVVVITHFALSVLKRMSKCLRKHTRISRTWLPFSGYCSFAETFTKFHSVKIIYFPHILSFMYASTIMMESVLADGALNNSAFEGEGWNNRLGSIASIRDIHFRGSSANTA